MSYDISPSPSDLFHSVWQSLDQSMLLEKKKKKHYFILFNDWLILHCIYVLPLPYSFHCPWTFRLLPYLDYCKTVCLLATKRWRISRSAPLSRTQSLDKVSIVKDHDEHWSKDIPMFILLIQVVYSLHIYKSYLAWFEFLLLSI